MKADSQPSLHLQSSMPLLDMEQLQNSQDIVRIVSAKVEVTKLEKLKKSFIGRYYRKRLRKYNFWKNLSLYFFHTVYIKINSIKLSFDKKNRFKLVKLSDYISKASNNKIIIINNEEIKIPKVFSISSNGDLRRIFKPITHSFPPIYVCKIKEANVMGGTNLISVKNSIIFHDFYNFHEDYSSEEANGHHFIDIQNMEIVVILPNFEEEISIAASFVDATAYNYAHWMTEILPRIAIFCSMDEYKDIPIVINDELNRNQMTSLLLIAGYARKIYLLPKDMQLRVNTLYTLSSIGYVPFGPRNKKVRSKNQGMYSPSALYLMRSIVMSFTNNLTNSLYSRKIYIRRNSAYRKLINSDEIEKYLIANNFAIIDPENLTFIEQVNLFANADIVLGPVGAAFANAIFSHERAKIGMMIGDHPDNPYEYWPSVINSFQCLDIQYILGSNSTNNSSAQGIHSDFYVSLADIKNFLNDV